MNSYPVLVLICLTVYVTYVSSQWNTVHSKWDDGSLSSTGGSYPMMGMGKPQHWSGANVQMVFVPFYQIKGMSQRSTFHKWDDGSTSTHDVWCNGVQDRNMVYYLRK